LVNLSQSIWLQFRFPFDHGCTGTVARADDERPDYSGLFVFIAMACFLQKQGRAIFVFITLVGQKKNRRR